jgi:predicted metal-dependent hydrolase
LSSKLKDIEITKLKQEVVILKETISKFKSIDIDINKFIEQKNYELEEQKKKVHEKDREIIELKKLLITVSFSHKNKNEN